VAGVVEGWHATVAGNSAPDTEPGQTNPASQFPSRTPTGFRPSAPGAQPRGVAGTGHPYGTRTRAGQRMKVGGSSEARPMANRRACPWIGRARLAIGLRVGKPAIQQAWKPAVRKNRLVPAAGFENPKMPIKCRVFWRICG